MFSYTYIYTYIHTYTFHFTTEYYFLCMVLCSKMKYILGRMKYRTHIYIAYTYSHTNTQNAHMHFSFYHRTPLFVYGAM